jgi:outer membrane protein with beta-barrel domain
MLVVTERRRKNKMWMAKVALLGFILLLGLTAMAQGHPSYPKFEVAVDYSYARYNPSHAFVKNGHSLNGGGGSITYNFNEYVGIKAEFTGYGSTEQSFVIPPGAITNCPAGCSGNVQGNLFTYLFGPQIGLRSGKFRPFGHVLFGGAHSNLYTNLGNISGFVGRANPSGNTFAMVFGGGVDIPVNHSGSIAIRPGEVDYLYTRFNNSVTGAQSSFRYQGGVVFNFGGK